MRILVIALYVSVSLFLAGCGKETAQIASGPSTPSPSPTSIMSESRTSATPYSETAPTPETASNPSPSPTAKVELVFKTEAATKAASEYLNAYNTLLNDINARPGPRGADPETALNNALAQLQKVTRDNAEVTNQQNKVEQVLSPDELTRLLQYRKTLEDATKTNQGEL